MVRTSWLAACLWLAACNCQSGTLVQGGDSDSGSPDSGGADAGVDAGGPDAGGADSGLADAGTLDSGPADSGPPDSGPSDSGVPDSGPVDAGVDAGPPVDLCPSGVKVCLAHDRKRHCGATAGGLRWLDDTCPAGNGCVQGDCVVGACSDECNWGDADGGAACELFDLASGGWSAPDAGASLHDRARAYNHWLRRDGMAAGSVGSASYTDPPTYSQLSVMDGIGDSALWTGTYLAAEALRFQVTGAPDAHANLLDLVGRVHLLLAVSGNPGNLARFVQPAGTVRSYQIPDMDCGNQRVHCGVTHQGTAYDYIGHVSRDQYQGVVLGYSLAFDALGPADSAVKDVIRSDMVTLVTELMKDRTISAIITVNGLPMPATPVTAHFIVVNPDEMNGGSLDLQLNLTGGSQEMWGFQEFYPDLAHLVNQVPGLSWVPSLPRPSSAIMLASFFRVALRMTENDAAHATEHAAILAYYTGHSGQGGNISDWLAVAEQWTPGTGCSQSYYSNNITMQPLYNLARLEDDPLRRPEIQNYLFTTLMWPTFEPTKNPFFSYIYAGTVSGVSGAVTSLAATQLAQFPPPPRVHVSVDLRADPRYPHDPTCADQVDHSTAVDVGDRIVGDFLWQRDPWQLYDPGNVAGTQPGVDYLVAYWLGRKHGFLPDDAVGRCLAWH